MTGGIYPGPGPDRQCRPLRRSDALHHQQVTTTARYARLMPGRLEQGVDRVAAAFERAAMLPATEKKDKTA